MLSDAKSRASAIDGDRNIAHRRALNQLNIIALSIHTSSEARPLVFRWLKGRSPNQPRSRTETLKLREAKPHMTSGGKAVRLKKSRLPIDFDHDRHRRAQSIHIVRRSTRFTRSQE